MLALFPILLLLVLLAPLLSRALGRRAGWAFGFLAAAVTLLLLAQWSAVTRTGALHIAWPWIPGLGVSYSLLLDHLSLLFGILIAGIGALIFVYAGGYLEDHPHRSRFFTTLLLFFTAMLGIVLADNLLLLFVFWELTSITSYFLIGFDHERESARQAALQALLVTGGGGLALLAGFLLLGHIGGSLEISQLLTRGAIIQAHPLYVPTLVLILLGAFTKSAQFPFHFWLPKAMEAPTPVSAYLHSATMVKAGIFLLLRLGPAMNGRAEWFYALTVVGTATLLTGAWLALGQSDLKKILAYSTISALGIMTAMLGSGAQPQVVGATLGFLVAHALYKGALFQIAGNLDHATGTRDVRRLNGLRKAMPVTGLTALLAALAMAAVPPLFSFIAKEGLFQTLLDTKSSSLLLAAVILASAVFVAVASMIGVRPFIGRPGGKEHPTGVHPHEAPLSLLLGPLVLAILGVAMGLFPTTLGAWLHPATVAATGTAIGEIKLTLWHGFNPALGFSLLTLGAGAGIYFLAPAMRESSRLPKLAQWGPARGYAAAMEGLNKVAGWQTRVLQNGRLSRYIAVVLLTLLSLSALWLLIVQPIGLPVLRWEGILFHEAALALFIILACLTVVKSKSRFAGIAALGMTGYGVALVYVLFGAPDLAMTQFLVESLTIILFVLVFHQLPDFTGNSRLPRKLRDGAIGLGAGTLMTVLVLTTHHENEFPPISNYFLSESLPGAHGRNVVNVILVDFRALDTLGEATVLALAALGVYALMKLRPRGKIS